MPRYNVRLELPDGGLAIVCMNQPAHPCGDCRERIAGFQCDAPAPGHATGTCDRWLCGQCGYHDRKAGRELCKFHARETQPELFDFAVG